MAIREKYIGNLIELFKAYMRSGTSIDAFEEVRYRASQLGKRLFKEKVPLDWIIGLYIEAVRSLESEAEEEALDLSGCRHLLLEMVMTYSTSFLKDLELTEQLEESEERFERIAERSFDAIITMDPTGRITYASSAAKTISGRMLRDFVGKRLHDFVHESDVPQLIRTFTEVMKGQFVNGLKIGMLREDGSSVTVEVNASPIISDRNVVGIEGIFRDITERKEAEEALRASQEKYENLVKNSYDIICVADESGNWTFLSPSVMRILGYEPDEMVGRSAFDFMFPEDVASTREAHRSVVREGKSLRQYENRWICKDGGIIKLCWNVVPLRDEQGRIIGMQGVGKDITQRKKSGQPRSQSDRLHESA